MTRWILGFVTAAALASGTSFPVEQMPADAWGVASTAPAPWLAEDPADSLYRLGREALNRNQYRRAAELFAELSKRHPRSGYAADALYWEAFARYRVGGSDDLRAALARLDDQKRRYPKAATAGDADALATRIRGELARQGDAGAAQDVVRVATEATAASPGASSSASATSSSSSDRSPKGDPDCDDDGDVKLAALNAVLQMDADRAMPLLTRVLARRDPGSVCLRRKAIWLVAQKRTDSTETVLLNSLRNDPDHEVREQAVFWLSQVPGPRAAAALDSIVRFSKDEQIQDRAVFALSQQDDPKASDALRALAERRDAPVSIREKAIFWLGQSKSGGPAYLRTLFPRLENDALKEKAIFAIAQSKRPEDQRWLIDMAKDGRTSIELRKQAIFWASQSGADAADLDGLYRGLADRELKEQVIFALAQTKDPAAVDKLIAIAKNDSDKELRKRALFWLGQSRDPRVANVLEQMLLED